MEDDCSLKVVKDAMAQITFIPDKVGNASSIKIDNNPPFSSANSTSSKMNI